MLGVNKFIGGTYRNTTLEQQSKTSAEILALCQPANIDLTNYTAARDSATALETPNVYPNSQAHFIATSAIPLKSHRQQPSKWTLESSGSKALNSEAETSLQQ